MAAPFREVVGRLREYGLWCLLVHGDGQCHEAERSNARSYGAGVDQVEGDAERVGQREHETADQRDGDGDAEHVHGGGVPSLPDYAGLSNRVADRVNLAGGQVGGAKRGDRTVSDLQDSEEQRREDQRGQVEQSVADDRGEFEEPDGDVTEVEVHDDSFSGE